MNIDYLKDKINNKLTKEYFQEVYKSYVNENYRSAIVFLNSVVLYDLYCKLEDMRDAHEDEKAKGILKAIKEKQQSNLYSSEWEKLLIERVANQTELLSVSEVSSLMRLRELRNQCAHPEISEHTSELYSPSRETTLATIVEVLQALLIKPPYFTNNVFNLLMAEIENKNNTNYNMFELEILIKNRYLNHMSESRQSKTFESLWKVVFKDKSERANHNRGINYCALLAYIKNCTFNYVEYMESRKNYFTIDSSYVRWLIDLMANFPKINNVLEESTNVEVEKELSHFRSKVLAFYKHETFSDHIDYLNAEIKKLKEESMFWPIYSNDVMTNILAIKIIANENLVMDRYFDFLIKMYTYAPTYDCADLAFDKLISTNYKKFSVEQIKNFIEGASENNQCYDRRAASYDHKLVLEFIRTLESNYVPPKNF